MKNKTALELKKITKEINPELFMTRLERVLLKALERAHEGNSYLCVHPNKINGLEEDLEKLGYKVNAEFGIIDWKEA